MTLGAMDAALTPRTRAKTGTHVDRAAVTGHQQQHDTLSKPHSAPLTHRSRTGADSRSGSPVPCLDDFLPYPYQQTPREHMEHLGARVCSHGVSKKAARRPDVLGGWGGAGAAAAGHQRLEHGKQAQQAGAGSKQPRAAGAAPPRRKLSAPGQLAPLNMAGLEAVSSSPLQALPALPRATAKLQHRCTDAVPRTYAAAVTAPGAASPASVAASQVLKSITGLPTLPHAERCSSPKGRGERHTGVQVELDTLTLLLDQLVTEEQQRYCWPGHEVEFKLIMQAGGASSSGGGMLGGDTAPLQDRTFLTSVPEAPDKAAAVSSSSQQVVSSSRSAPATNLPMLPTASCLLQSPRAAGLISSRSSRLAAPGAAEGVPDLTIQGGPTASVTSDLSRLLPPIGVAASADLSWAKRVKLAEDAPPAAPTAESSAALKPESSHAASDACAVKQQDSRSSLGHKAAWEANIKRSLRESAPSYHDLMRQLSAIQRLPTCGSQRTSKYLQQLQEAQRGPAGGSTGRGLGLGALAASPEQMRQLSCDATPLLDTLACLPDLQAVMAERGPMVEATGCKMLRSSLNWKVTPPAYKLPQIGSSWAAPDA